VRARNEMILADLIQIRAEERPDLDVLTFEHLSLDGGTTPDEVRTFADLQTNANRLAAALLGKGLARGDRFAIMMRNHPEFVEAAVAASITGALFVPVDPRTRGDKLAYILGDAGCAGIICTDYCLAEIDAVRGQLPDLKWIFAIETSESVIPADAGIHSPPISWMPAQETAGMTEWEQTVPALSSFGGVESLSEVFGTPAATVDVRADNPDAPLQIMYTSGTTGDAKGIVGANFRFCAAGMLGMLFGYQSDERPYTGLSLSHGNAQSVTLAPALTMGLRAVFSRRFTKSKLWDVCRRYGCTTFSLVGGMATEIYSAPARPGDADNPVRMVVSGGMPAAIWEAFEQRFYVKILEFYGAMDGGGMAYKPIGEGPVGSFGKPMPGIEMKILDAAGNECAPGAVGEICCRPAGGGEASVEYFGNPEASAKKIRGGWNRSGDMGHSDADGWLFFDYRAGGGIRHNGDFINPSFVEKVIAEHPGVTDVYVYGVPAASGAPGEKDVVAVIVPATGARFEAASVFAACRATLEANFVPTYLQVVEEIPKTASEKPVERILIEQFNPRAGNVYTEERRP
jgi:crotonobetaine/carnitine-CoA ligase